MKIVTYKLAKRGQCPHWRDFDADHFKPHYLNLDDGVTLYKEGSPCYECWGSAGTNPPPKNCPLRDAPTAQSVPCLCERCHKNNATVVLCDKCLIDYTVEQLHSAINAV